MDSWSDMIDIDRWWKALADVGIDVNQALHQPYEIGDKLPWDHLNVKYGRTFLEKEQAKTMKAETDFLAIQKGKGKGDIRILSSF